MMRYFFLIVSMLVLMPSLALAQGFFHGLPDIPLMPGLVEMEERALSFDKPEGRILMAYALVGDSVDAQSLLSYYSQSLPAFGWGETSPLSYQREGENLNLLLIKHADGRRVLEITISP